MERRWHIVGMLAGLVLSFSCGRPDAPPVTLLVPQVVSSEVVPDAESVRLYASLSGSGHFTGCGFGIVKDGMIQEVPGVLLQGDMGFSAETGGLSPQTEYGFYAFVSNRTSRIQTPVRPFRTLPAKPDPPALRFTAVSCVPSVRTALLTATLSQAEEVTASGFSFSEDGVHFTDFPVPLTGDGLSLTVSDLQPDTEYRFCAWAVQREKRVTSETGTFRTRKETPAVRFIGLDAAPEAFSVQLSARVDDAAPVQYCGFGLSREGRMPVEYAAVAEGNTFRAEIDGLIPGMEYTFYAFVLVDGQRITSDFSVFTTSEDTALRIVDVGASAEETAVRLRARLTRAEGVVAAGFALAGSGNDFLERAAPLERDGRFVLTWEGLSPDTGYRFYAWAQTDTGRVVSDPFDFYTRPVQAGKAGFVSVTATPGEDAVLLKAVLRAAETVSSAGFGLSVNQYDYAEYDAALDGDGFQRSFSGLEKGVTYYFYAFFTCPDGYRRSETLSFSLP